MSSAKVFVASPIHGQPTFEFMVSLLNLRNQPDCVLDVHLLAGHSLVPRARNILAADFLKSDCSHILFVDADQVFQFEHVRQLLARDKEVIGGFVALKNENHLRWAMGRAGTTEPVFDETNLLETGYIGTGFVLVARGVFDKMIERYGDAISYYTEPEEELQYDFFPAGAYQMPGGKRRYHGEDWYFSQRWTDMGGKIWADGNVVIGHMGMVSFPLKSQMAGLKTVAKLPGS